MGCHIGHMMVRLHANSVESVILMERSKCSFTEYCNEKTSEDSAPVALRICDSVDTAYFQINITFEQGADIPAFFHVSVKCT